MKKILIISDETPGEFTGGQRSILHRAQFLARYGQLDLLSNNYESSFDLSERNLETVFNNIEVVDLERDLGRPFNFLKVVKSVIQLFFSIYPREAYLAKNVQIQKYLANKENDYDVILVENVNTAINLKGLKLKKDKIFVINHNIENELMKSFSNVNLKNRKFLKSFFFYIEYLKYFFFEKKIWKNYNTICISKSDKNYLDDRNIESIYLPQSLPERKDFWQNPTSNYLVFNSNLFYQPNIEGLGWFVENVVNEIVTSCPDFKLFVTGRCQEDIIENLVHTNIVFTGFLEEVEFEKLLLNSRGIIAPIFTGSGVKIKILDAMSLGVPIITTTHCVEGLDFISNIVYTDNAIKFKELCIQALKGRNRYDDYLTFKNKKELIEKSWLEKLNLNE